MKKLKKLKLTKLSQEEIAKRELNKLSGGSPGECCICANGYYNHFANSDGGLYSPSLVGSFTRVR